MKIGRIRQIIAIFIYRRMWNMKKLAAWVDPSSTVAILMIGYSKGKVRFAYYRPYIGDATDDLGITVEDWFKTSIRINNMIEENKDGCAT